MLKKLTHTGLIVKDQEKALRFFVDKIGLEKRDDNPMEETQRWLTVGCKGQSDVEIILQSPEWGMQNSSTEEKRSQIGKQSLSFASDNIQEDYKNLQEKGVKVLGEPVKMPWGMQLLLKICMVMCTLLYNSLWLSKSLLNQAGKKGLLMNLTNPIS